MTDPKDRKPMDKPDTEHHEPEEDTRALAQPSCLPTKTATLQWVAAVY